MSKFIRAMSCPISLPPTQKSYAHIAQKSMYNVRAFVVQSDRAIPRRRPDKRSPGMSIDRSLIGTSSPPQTFEVTREAVQRFMEATEDPALHTGAPVEYAPPTFPTTFRMRIPGLELDNTRMQLLHGEQEYKYTRRLRIGEQVTCVVSVADVRQ